MLETIIVYVMFVLHLFYLCAVFFLVAALTHIVISLFLFLVSWLFSNDSLTDLAKNIRSTTLTVGISLVVVSLLVALVFHFMASETLSDSRDFSHNLHSAFMDVMFVYTLTSCLSFMFGFGRAMWKLVPVVKLKPPQQRLKNTIVDKTPRK